MKISRKFKGCYISCLPDRMQTEMKREIVETLKDAGIDRAEMKEMTAEVMASRVTDVESVIEFEYF